MSEQINELKPLLLDTVLKLEILEELLNDMGDRLSTLEKKLDDLDNRTERYRLEDWNSRQNMDNLIRSCRGQ